MLVWLKKDRSR